MNIHSKLKWQTIVDRLNKEKRFGEFRLNPGFIYKYSNQYQAFIPNCNIDIISKKEFINNTINW